VPQQIVWTEHPVRKDANGNYVTQPFDRPYVWAKLHFVTEHYDKHGMLRSCTIAWYREDTTPAAGSKPA
jgi:hypothetical protein